MFFYAKKRDIKVHITGVEPARTIVHQPLKLTRLPIPPYVHGIKTKKVVA